MNNRKKILAALGFLVAISSAFSNELDSLIKPGNNGQGVQQEPKVRLTRHTVFVRKAATDAANTFHIIDENTKKLNGISSISDRKLPKNQAVIFDKIAVGFAEGDADGLEGALDYTSTKAPAVLRNASIVITQNGREVMDLPVADMVKVTSPASAADYYHDLEGFNYLVDDQPMEWFLRFPDGQSLAPSAAGKKNYIEIRLQGYKTSRKQQ